MNLFNLYCSNDCNQYLQSKGLVLVFFGKRTSLQEKVVCSLRHKYKEGFLKRVIFHSALVPEDELIDMAGDSFEQCLLIFIEHIKLKYFKEQNKNFEKYIFSLYKNIYFERFTGTLLSARQKETSGTNLKNSQSN